MELANRAITGFFSALFWPLTSLPPVWALIVISVVAGAAMVWAFGRVSKQDEIAAVKDQIRGKLFGVRLYQHEIGVVLRLQRQILGHTVRYMALSALPMLILMVPIALLIVQMNLYFANRPLRPGEQALVKVKVGDASLLDRAPLTLKGDPSFVVETPAVRAVAAKEVAWRIRAVRPGRHSVTVQIGERQIEKDLQVGSSWGAVSSLRTSSWLDYLLYPAEPRLEPQAGIKAVEVGYRRLPLQVLGWNLDWLISFFVLSVVAGFALKGVFGVKL